MNYGQKSQLTHDDIQSFFTAGSGNLPSDYSYSAPENNLDLTHQPAWMWPGISQEASEEIPEQISPALQIHNQFTEQESARSHRQDRQQIDQSPESLQPQSQSPKPQSSQPQPVAQDVVHETYPKPNPMQYNHHAIRTNGDHLTKSAIHEVEQTIVMLNQTGDIASFYSTIRGDEHTPGMLGDNLKNSYHKEIA